MHPYDTLFTELCISDLVCGQWSNMSVFHDEVEIEDFEFDEEEGVYYYPCPCGDRYTTFQFLSVQCLQYNFSSYDSPGPNCSWIPCCLHPPFIISSPSPLPKQLPGDAKKTFCTRPSKCIWKNDQDTHICYQMLLQSLKLTEPLLKVIFRLFQRKNI